MYLFSKIYLFIRKSESERNPPSTGNLVCPNAVVYRPSQPRPGARSLVQVSHVGGRGRPLLTGGRELGQQWGSRT